MTIRLKPLRDRVWISKDTPDDMTKGGIVIPEVCKDPPMTGTIVAVGPGRISSKGYHIPMESQVGDRVVFRKYNGCNVVIEDEKFFLLSEKDIEMRFSSIEPPVDDR